MINHKAREARKLRSMQRCQPLAVRTIGGEKWPTIATYDNARTERMWLALARRKRQWVKEHGAYLGRVITRFARAVAA